MSGAYEARMNAGDEIMQEEASVMFDDGLFDDQIKELIMSGEFDKEVRRRATLLGFIMGERAWKERGL